MSLSLNTIAAISTPPGKGGVAVIRISGNEAADICRKIFRPIGKASPEQAPRKAIYGHIIYRNEPIDDGLACYFPAPNSYTGEDTVEISCHGGILISRTVLEAALAAGARYAQAGEFTRRAFMNGRLSLSEADAIGLLLEAKTEAQIKLARSEAREKLNKKILQISERITELLGSVFARIDYPDEDLGDFSDAECHSALCSIRDELRTLIDTYKTGRAVRDGINTSIVGRPNAGKSSLYNLLAGEELAIVTDIPGTTRDVLERSVPLGKVMLNLADTAGIRENAADAVEAIGISRSKKKIESSELVFALFDATAHLTDEDEALIKELGEVSAEKIAIITKADTADTQTLNSCREILSSDFKTVIEISVTENGNSAILKITETVEQLFTDGKIQLGTDAVVSSSAQYASLLRAAEHINAAISAFEVGLPQDVSSSDIELALVAISEIDGRAASEAVVDNIFSRFCVGK